MSTTDSTPQVNNDKKSDQESESIPQSNPETMDTSSDLVDKEATSIVDKAGEPECVKVTHDLHAEDEASPSPKKDEDSTPKKVDQLTLNEVEDTTSKEDEGASKKEEEAVVSSSLPADVEDVKIDLDTGDIESKPEQEDKLKEEEDKPKEEEDKPKEEEAKEPSVEEEKMEVDTERTEAKEASAGKESTPVAAEGGPKKRGRKAAVAKTPATPPADSIASSRPRRSTARQVNYSGTSDAAFNILAEQNSTKKKGPATKATPAKKGKQTKRKATSDSEDSHEQDDGESDFEDKPSTKSAKKGKATKSSKKEDEEDVEVMPVSKKRAAPTTSAALDSTPKRRGRPAAKKSKADGSPGPEGEEVPACSEVAPTVAE